MLIDGNEFREIEEGTEKTKVEGRVQLKHVLIEIHLS